MPLKVEVQYKVKVFQDNVPESTKSDVCVSQK